MGSWSGSVGLASGGEPLVGHQAGLSSETAYTIHAEGATCTLSSSSSHTRKDTGGDFFFLQILYFNKISNKPHLGMINSKIIQQKGDQVEKCHNNL